MCDSSFPLAGVKTLASGSYQPKEFFLIGFDAAHSGVITLPCSKVNEFEF